MSKTQRFSKVIEYLDGRSDVSARMIYREILMLE